MSLVSPTQSSPGETIEANDINEPVNQLASVINGNIESANLANDAVTSSKLADSAVTNTKLAASAITLGYTQITANITTTSVSSVQATGLTVTVTVPGTRRIRITAYSASFGSSGTASAEIWDGVVGSGTKLQQWNAPSAGSPGMNMQWASNTAPASGSKTYNVAFRTSSGTATISAGSDFPAYILVEAI